MKVEAILRTVGGLILVLQLSAVRAAEPTSNTLRYKFVEGMTNGYRVTLESPSETSPFHFEGLILVAVRSTSDQGAILAFRSHITPKRTDRSPGMMPQFGPPGAFAPGNPWGGNWMTTMFQPGNQTQIDPNRRLALCSVATAQGQRMAR
jgi:hypothetical protein